MDLPVPLALGPDLALNAPVAASSTTSGYPASNAVDGNASTYWEGTDGVGPTTLTVTIALPPGTTDQYVQLSVTANSVQNGAQVSELNIYS